MIAPVLPNRMSNGHSRKRARATQRPVLLGLMSLAAILLAGRATAQTPEAIAESKTFKINYDGPFAGYWPGDAAGGAVAIYSLPQYGGFPERLTSRLWIARKVQELPTEFEIRWIDARDCPALLGVISWLTELQPPPVSSPGRRDWLPRGEFGRPPPPPPNPDTTDRAYTVWGTGHDANGGSIEVTFGGWTDLMRSFGDAAVERLEPCWTVQAPPEATTSARDIASQGQRRRSPEEPFPAQPPRE